MVTAAQTAALDACMKNLVIKAGTISYASQSEGDEYS